ncbi:MAG TPA: TonB-dependent receptor [Puia sp.]|nr:TonB-dependent receptor [Puia sp.]
MRIPLIKPSLITAVALILTTASVFAQTPVTLSGSVHNATTKERVPAVSVVLKGFTTGTFTDDRGNFRLSTTTKPPYILVFSSIGFETQEITVNEGAGPIQVDFKPASTLGTEVVVSASRVPERILESPVSIERVGSTAIRNSPATSYYDVIRTLKGVDVVASSLTFSSVTTRGFNGSGNPKFNQFVDGMDNQAPGLNFSVGSVIGLSDLDVDNMELLSGASSALYGSGGTNGTLLITSKDPFKYQGVSAQVKEGIMHLGKNDPVGTSAFNDISLRWGMKVSDKFAFKLGIQYIEAKDWVATDSSNSTGTGAGPGNYPIGGTRTSDPNYNGVNVYGDETSVNLYPSVPVAYRPLLPIGTTSLYVSRTGYKEKDVIDPSTKDLRLTGGLYYKFTPHLMLSLTGNYGTGNTVYTGSDRYSLRNLKMGQYKLELRADRWFLRAYTTQENSGQAYNATVTTQLFNEAWSPSTTWYNTYLTTLLGARAQGADWTTSNQAARAAADVNRPQAGSAQFKSIFDQVRAKPIPTGGLFVDRTNMYQTEGQYNLSDYVKVVDLVVGASWRQYVLNSQGTLFADSAGRIKTNEYGAYAEVSKRLFSDVLKLTAAGRYDKNDNFDGKFTPRFSAVVTVAKDNFIRAAFQNAYRFPSNQNQWINLNTGSYTLIGGLPELRSFYHFDTQPVYTYASVLAYQQSGDPTVLKQASFGKFKPETVNSYELGYKGIIAKNLLIDAYGYYSHFNDFISRTTVVQLNTQKVFSVSVNSPNTINSYGFGLSLDYLLPQNFAISLNASSDRLHNPDSTFVTYYNTPKYRFNIGFSNSGFGPGKKLGFNAQYRWQDKYFTESDFRQGNVNAFGTIDAQISYKLPLHSLVKLGATNLLNHYYVSAYGNPAIGGLYYISLGYNIF